MKLKEWLGQWLSQQTGAPMLEISEPDATALEGGGSRDINTHIRETVFEIVFKYSSETEAYDAQDAVDQALTKLVAENGIIRVSSQTTAGTIEGTPAYWALVTLARVRHRRNWLWG